MIEYKSLRLEKTEGVVEAVLIGPGKGNAMGPDFWREMPEAFAREIAGNPPLVVQGIKRVMNYCADKSVADGLGYVAVWNSAFLQSADLAEAMTAFRYRRAPQFKGR